MTDLLGSGKRRVGVAISTTGDEHRLGFLETSVEAWLNVGLGPVVTVDGSPEDAQRVVDRLHPAVPVFRVGQRAGESAARLGVAVNKNTGIELLYDRGVEHFFLCDDDTWPRNAGALREFISPGTRPHGMVNWGWHRLTRRGAWVEWTWPRGCLLYMRRLVLDQVGGMIEEFGLGGHEHVEYSRRIHQAGLTETPYPAPSYMTSKRGLGAAVNWHAEDMPKPGEPFGNLRARRRRITSIKRPDGYWANAEAIMDRMDGNPAFVPFRAADNGRTPASII